METQEIRIRLVEERDFNAWLRMRRSLWPHNPETRHLAEMKDYSRPDNETMAFVAEDEAGELWGFVEVRIRPFAEGHEQGAVGYVEGIWVDPGHRRQGLAHQLLRRGEEWVRSKGCNSIASDCNADNNIAIRMHLEEGYIEVERLVHFIKRV